MRPKKSPPTSPKILQDSGLFDTERSRRLVARYYFRPYARRKQSTLAVDAASSIRKPLSIASGIAFT
jgi:hypothetical protein